MLIINGDVFQTRLANILLTQSQENKPVYFIIIAVIYPL